MDNNKRMLDFSDNIDESKIKFKKKSIVYGSLLDCIESKELINDIISIFNNLDYSSVERILIHAFKGKFIIQELFNKLYFHNFLAQFKNKDLSKLKKNDISKKESLENNDKLLKNPSILSNNINYNAKIPIKCNNDSCFLKIKNKETIDCIYAHNIEEINFNYYNYKTTICEDIKNCKFEDYLQCGKCHDLNKDFRFIYKYDDPKIQIVMSKLFNSKLGNQLRNYEYYYNIENDKHIFDIQSFKVKKCRLNLCGITKNFYVKINEEEIDSERNHKKFCSGYFNDSDKRRPQLLFRYSIKDCESLKSKNNCIYYPFCLYSHNKIEIYYHNDYFNKGHTCPEQNHLENKSCFALKSCYLKHLGYSLNFTKLKCHNCYEYIINEKYKNCFKLECKHIYCNKCIINCVYNLNFEEKSLSPLKNNEELLVFMKLNVKNDKLLEYLKQKSNLSDEFFNCFICNYPNLVEQIKEINLS